MAAGLLFGASGAAGAGAAAGAASAGLFGVGGSFSLMQTLSTVGTIMSTASMFTGGNAAAQDAATQAAWERVRAANAGAAAAQEQLSVREKLKRVQAQNFATYAARGLSLEGTPGAVFEESERQAARELDISRYNASQDITAAKGSAAATMARGYSARDSMRARGVATLFDKGTDLYNKGAFS